MTQIKKESFVFYESFYAAIKDLDSEIQLEVLHAIFEHVFYDNDIELKPYAKALYMVMKPNIDNAIKRYYRNVENGKKGGRPKTQTKPKNNPNKTQEKPKQNQDVYVYDNVDVDVDDNVNVNVNDNKIKKELLGEFKNVKLSKEEIEKVKNIYNEKFSDAIELLSNYIASSGRKYKSHYAVLGKHNWVYSEIFKNSNKSSQKLDISKMSDEELYNMVF